jgi:hypothetical protein
MANGLRGRESEEKTGRVYRQYLLTGIKENQSSFCGIGIHRMRPAAPGSTKIDTIVKIKILATGKDIGASNFIPNPTFQNVPFR